MNYCGYFKGKKITVMGLGLLGRGIGDVRTLARCGAELLVTDLKSKEALAPSLIALKDFPDIIYVLGEHRPRDFRDCDMVLKAAGVPFDSPYIAEARTHNIPIAMSGALFAELSSIPIVGVTGTRGKSTVTHLIHHVLLRAAETTKDDVLLGGNVRGVSNLALLDEITEKSIAVMELDSWQLQGFGESKISPHIAVFTNFLDDHLNYYRNNRDAYFADKAQIFLHQGAGDVFVTTPAVFERAQTYAKAHSVTFAQEIVLVGESLVPDTWKTPLVGTHNRRNVALACAALRAAQVPDEIIQVGVETFRGLPGRLEFLGEHNGVQIYNDNNATTPDATIAALRALGTDGKNIVLIMGGADKGSDLVSLLEATERYTKHIELLAGTGTDRIKEYLPNVRVHMEMDTAVTAALEHAERGDMLLLSPAFASFGIFQNEYDRNDQFVAAVKRLGKKSA